MRSNETQLMGKLDQIIIIEAKDQIQLQSDPLQCYNQSQDQLELIPLPESNPLDITPKVEQGLCPLEDSNSLGEKLILDIKQEEEQIVENIYENPISSANLLAESKTSEASAPRPLPFRRRKQILIPRTVIKPIKVVKLPPKPLISKESSAPIRPVRLPHPKIPELDKEIQSLPGTCRDKVKCVRCSKLILKLNYRMHVEQTHLRLKNFTCDICGKQFYRFDVLAEHMNKHLNAKPLSCHFECGEFFGNSATRKKHELKVHLGGCQERICELCGKIFKAEKYLIVSLMSKM